MPTEWASRFHLCQSFIYRLSGQVQGTFKGFWASLSVLHPLLGGVATETSTDRTYSGAFTSTLTLWGVTDCRGMVTGEITVHYC